MGFALDPATASHARALARLESERIGWLGSTGRDGFPHAVPVWFLWHDDAVLTFSQPNSAKVRNLRADPRAMFHLEAGADGEQVQVLQGLAEFSPDPTAVWMQRVGDAYVAKYAESAAAIGWPLQRTVDEFTLAIIVRPHRLIP